MGKFSSSHGWTYPALSQSQCNHSSGRETRHTFSVKGLTRAQCNPLAIPLPFLIASSTCMLIFGKLLSDPPIANPFQSLAVKKKKILLWNLCFLHLLQFLDILSPVVSHANNSWVTFAQRLSQPKWKGGHFACLGIHCHIRTCTQYFAASEKTMRIYLHQRSIFINVRTVQKQFIQMNSSKAVTSQPFYTSYSPNTNYMNSHFLAVFIMGIILAQRTQ